MTVTVRLPEMRLPMLAAPMFLVSGPELVIAAGRAGIIGAFPSPNCRTTADLDSWMGQISDSLGPEGRWAVNLVTHRSNSRLDDDLRLVDQYRPPVVITALGSPKPVMETVKGYGGLVIADVVNVALAQKAVAAGVDGLACISAGAGGHTGHLSPFAFVSAVRQFFDGLIIVGGGIADGHALAGAITAGADLAYVGTRFLATQESLAAPEYKQMVVDLGIDDIEVSATVTGTPASWLRPSLHAAGYGQTGNTAPQRDYDTNADPAKRWKDIWAAGQGLNSIQNIRSVKETVTDMETEYLDAVQRMCARVSTSQL
ncbi:NAD(P)H-dependent flavin oxidoreductase [Sciscionella marina]|uniref:NAD(P)H-dependent flavin oxidoreductase n=1 Tax=Sciscionella marina TaxID=508770 RepID=UPI00036CC51F|nr:nitronate monooxygenase [Sciscionella marina]